MLLYDALSPGPRTVRMFLLEKNLAIPTRQIDVFAGENRQHPFRDSNLCSRIALITRMNPMNSSGTPKKWPVIFNSL